MSSVLLSSNHLNLLVAAGNGGQEKFEMLLAQNLRSFMARYEDRRNDLAASHAYEPRPIDEIVRIAIADWERPTTFSLPDDPTLIVPLVAQTLILKACDCYDANACDTNDYTQTDAAAFIARVRAETDARRSVLYDSLPWWID